MIEFLFYYLKLSRFNMNTAVFSILLSTVVLVSQAGACKDLLHCGIFCHNGYQQDENGCDICQCVDDEFIVCPILECEGPLDCTPTLDDDGCPTCSCVSVCEPRNCGIVPVICEYGFEKDEDGCETCTCIPPPDCPGDPVPVACGASCGPATCQQRLTAIYPFCLACVPSCQCPKPNTFLDTNGRCVPAEGCGCVDDNNNYYRKWSVNFIYVNGKVRRCVCFPGNRLKCSKGGYY
ncbi:uncharacterized protein [Antedon mediterranea]|uniref:uncharacterized protein n=1 Tax=Antedon mediterranea TaxID=105859 RepID=UPI003AF5F8DF